MKPFKVILILAAILISLTFTLPSLLVLRSSEEKVNAKLDEVDPAPIVATDSDQTEVAVFRASEDKIETIPLEEYVVGVVASEMPADFELEALKAQALAARTYIVNHLLHAKKDESLPKDANIDDTEKYQVFRSLDELKVLWEKDFDWKYKKVVEAVKATEGEIITYRQQPITASFFSTSNGYTENAEEYWENQIPYLKSVESPWDSKSPKFESKKELPVKDFEKLLGVQVGNKNDVGTITKRTAGKKVAEVKIGSKTFTGRDIREKLGLRSTDFSWVRKGDNIIISTKGFGHGVGMSQYGANFMAEEGKNYKDIVKYYYKDIDITEAQPVLDRKLASTQ